jgi:hypothetical protein
MKKFDTKNKANPQPENDAFNASTPAPVNPVAHPVHSAIERSGKRLTTKVADIFFVLPQACVMIHLKSKSH